MPLCELGELVKTKKLVGVLEGFGTNLNSRLFCSPFVVKLHWENTSKCFWVSSKFILYFNDKT
jgi:hypothetical protein